MAASIISGPSGPLEIAFDLVATPLALGIVCHPHPLHGGTMNNKVVTTVSKALNDLGTSVIRFNYRGVGNSAGTWDEGRGETEDALAALQHAQRTCGANLPIIAAGFSFGAFVASELARRGSVAKLLLIAPAVSRFAVGAVPTHAGVIHGEQDDVVPLPEVLHWARPQQLPVTVMPGAGHFFHGALLPLRAAVRTLCRL